MRRGGSEEWIVGLGMVRGWGLEMSEISLSFSFFDGQFSHCTFKVEFWASPGEVGGAKNFRLAPRISGLAAGEGILGRNFWN